MEENLHSINSMRNMEVIEVNTGKKLGFIYDIKIDCENDKVDGLILPGENKGWFQKEDEIEIPWDNVVKIGMDVILVSLENLNLINIENNKYN
ncbi:YlmC/YmxH family sporulation protein [Clostridium thermobutyricum]|jgi:YlmC/YmxH family sporulation protein|uniref:YlmC/YmxH family sporulation protein n=1 Tax=Clostridium thermobutyricum TaxID=29372 RepID=N9Y1N2_9CLOT|nr:YlmC/YmxH family sporulation protein [Clostridium thermobutyricum]ENZ01712.1 YlmC/YmxH family sporulation protein [Clostridium thermobutyricum]